MLICKFSKQTTVMVAFLGNSSQEKIIPCQVGLGLFNGNPSLFHKLSFRPRSTFRPRSMLEVHQHETGGRDRFLY